MILCSANRLDGFAIGCRGLATKAPRHQEAPRLGEAWCLYALVAYLWFNACPVHSLASRYHTWSNESTLQTRLAGSPPGGRIRCDILAPINTHNGAPGDDDRFSRTVQHGYLLP